MVLLLGALFVIIWYALGGLRSSFGKALMIFSVVGIMVVGGFVLYAINATHESDIRHEQVLKTAVLHNCPTNWIWDSTNQMCDDPTFKW